MAEAPNTDDKTVANTATEDDIKVLVEGEDDPKIAAAKNEDGDEEDGEVDEERERIREARRAERRDRSRRRAEAIERDRSAYNDVIRQNRELAERLAALEGRTHQQDARQIDERLSATLREHEQAERVLADAITKGDGQLAQRALRVRDDAVRKHNELQSVKARITEAPRQPQQQGPDPVVQRFAQDWAEDNAWYNPASGDPDSNIVLAIDDALAKEGFDPRTEEYWEELDVRVARALPNKRKPASTRKSPPISGGRDGVSTAAAKTFVVSADRKKAMMDSGAWDDPVKRAKQIRAYAEYDKQNPRR